MAIRITRVYTRGGDGGETGVVGGGRVPKDSPRIVAYGTVDELNSVIGVCREALAAAAVDGAARVVETLRRVQNDLFDLGSELATPTNAEYEGMWKASDHGVEALEAEIDSLQEELEPLKSFVLPGGGLSGAQLHVARTVCRRAEIETLRLSREASVNPAALRYLNRLSDLLFVMARWVSRRAGEPELLWERGLTLPTKKAR